MPRVLFLDQFAGLGGGQRILLDIVEHFCGHGIECAAAFPENGPLCGPLRKVGAELFDLQLSKMSAGRKSVAEKLGYVSATRKVTQSIMAIADSWKPDAIFCNSPRCMLGCMFAANRLGRPMMGAVHLYFSGLPRAILAYCFRAAAVKGVLYCSAYAKSSFADVPGDKTVLVGNWVSKRFISAPKTHNARSKFGIPEGLAAVGAVGRLSRNKGQRDLLEAMAPLSEFVLVLAGSTDFEYPGERAELESLAERLGISNSVRFLGQVEDVVALMDALDVLAVPSHSEAFGLSAAEAMARGVPVVAYRVGGLSEVVRDGETGLLVKEEPSALREGIGKLLADARLRADMGFRSAALSRESFAPRAKLEAIEAFVRGLGPRN